MSQPPEDDGLKFGSVPSTLGADPPKRLGPDTLGMPPRNEKVIPEGTLYTSRGNRSMRVQLSPYQTLGWRIFRVVVGLVAVMLAAVVAWAILTYPSLDDVIALAENDPGADKLQLWREAKAEWVQQLVTVSQLAVFGTLVPLLGTIAGYLLGQRAAAGDETTETI